MDPGQEPLRAQIIACDAGGTMTDTIIVDAQGRFSIGKASTTPMIKASATSNPSRTGSAIGESISGTGPRPCSAVSMPSSMRARPCSTR